MVVSSVTPLMPAADARPALRVLGERALERLEDDAELLVVGGRRVRHRAGLLELDALVDEQRGVAAVVEDHVRAVAVRPGAAPARCTTSTPRASRPSRRRRGCRPRRWRRRRGPGWRRCCRRPSGPRRRGDERLDQHGGLDRHVQRAGDPRALERLRVGVLARASPSGRASRARRAGSPCGRRRRARGRRPCSPSSGSWIAMRSPREVAVRAAASSRRWCFSCSQRSQSAAGTSSGRSALASSQASVASRSPGSCRRRGEGEVGRGRCRAPRAARAGCAGAAARPGRRGGSRTASARARPARRARRSAACAATSRWSPPPRGSSVRPSGGQCSATLTQLCQGCRRLA